VLNRMVRDGLVTREEHSKDRRQVVLILTPKGRDLWRKISSRYEAGVEKVFGVLPASRRQRFFDDLKVLHDALLSEEVSGELDNRWDSRFFPVNGAP